MFDFIIKSHIGWIFWIDVCPVDGNLLVSGGNTDVKVYDRRVSKIVRTFEKVHRGKIGFCPHLVISFLFECK